MGFFPKASFALADPSSPLLRLGDRKAAGSTFSLSSSPRSASKQAALRFALTGEDAMAAPHAVSGEMGGDRRAEGRQVSQVCVLPFWRFLRDVRFCRREELRGAKGCLEPANWADMVEGEGAVDGGRGWDGFWKIN